MGDGDEITEACIVRGQLHMLAVPVLCEAVIIKGFDVSFLGLYCRHGCDLLILHMFKFVDHRD